mmetsp:Transcript_25423/g.28281  ORF Transcript_25423/g.28281 Transcript_25423/m.28281 type:complete len:156 (+) Transcript_25423:60-527(+)
MASITYPNDPGFTYILRIMNTNVDGKRKVDHAMTAIKGIGYRFSTLACKKAEIDLRKRAGELSQEEIERLVNVFQHPKQFGIPNWFLNRQKDFRTGEFSQVLVNGLDVKMREDLIRLKKIRAHRGLRHHWRLRVRGQRTKTTGRRGSTIGFQRKK